MAVNLCPVLVRYMQMNKTYCVIQLSTAIDHREADVFVSIDIYTINNTDDNQITDSWNCDAKHSKMQMHFHTENNSIYQPMN